MELNESLRAVVAVLAEAHERAEPEFVGVAAMWLDVITNLCGRIKVILAGVRVAGAFGCEPSDSSNTTCPTSSVDRGRSKEPRLGVHVINRASSSSMAGG
jgi:hypothetical protein